MPSRSARTRFVRALAGATIAAALIGAGTAIAADQAVAISGFSYSPATVTVSVGDTVTWTNSDAQAHTATADDASWDSGTIGGSGGTGEVTFSAAGTYPYHCSIHSGMNGTITVEAAAGGGGGATTPPTDTVPTGADTDPAGATGATGVALIGLAVVSLAWAAGLVLARRRFTDRG